MKIVISSGHGKFIRGASGYLDEVDEARRVVDRVAALWRAMGVAVITFHDDVSTTQNANLNRIVDFHNAQGKHDLDVSVHFNAYEYTAKPMGPECLYVTQEKLAGEVSAAIADVSGLPDRGAKYRDDLFFLNNTIESAILIETLFVDSSADSNAYDENFDFICRSIAEAIAEEEEVPSPGPPPNAVFTVTGSCSWFGGPDDTGVSPDEGLAFFYKVEDAPHLFLPKQPADTTGLARRLNPGLFYVACRWDYERTSKGDLSDPSVQALVRANGREFMAWPADWGPHEDTGRVADLSPALMDALGLETGDEVDVVYPARLE